MFLLSYWLSLSGSSSLMLKMVNAFLCFTIQWKGQSYPYFPGFSGPRVLPLYLLLHHIISSPVITQLCLWAVWGLYQLKCVKSVVLMTQQLHTADDVTVITHEYIQAGGIYSEFIPKYSLSVFRDNWVRGRSCGLGWKMPGCCWSMQMLSRTDNCLEAPKKSSRTAVLTELLLRCPSVSAITAHLNCFEPVKAFWCSS